MLDTPCKHGCSHVPRSARGTIAAGDATSPARAGLSSLAVFPPATSLTARAASALLAASAILRPSKGRMWRFKFDASMAQVLARLAGFMAGPSAK